MIVLTDEQRMLARMLDEGHDDLLGVLTDSCFESASETPLQAMLAELLSWAEGSGANVPCALLEKFRAAIIADTEARQRLDRQLAVLVEKMRDTKQQAYWADESRKQAIEGERQAREQLNAVSETRRESSSTAAALAAKLASERSARLEAEAMVLGLQKQLETESVKLILAAPTEQSAQPGLVFPYSTKELEAMRDAALKHWAGYTMDKRQPTQKAIALGIGERLNLPRQTSGDPARKAMILATAIKPDALPEA